MRRDEVAGPPIPHPPPSPSPFQADASRADPISLPPSAHGVVGPACELSRILTARHTSPHHSPGRSPLNLGPACPIYNLSAWEPGPLPN